MNEQYLSELTEGIHSGFKPQNLLPMGRTAPEPSLQSPFRNATKKRLKSCVLIRIREWTMNFVRGLKLVWIWINKKNTDDVVYHDDLRRIQDEHREKYYFRDRGFR